MNKPSFWTTTKERINQEKKDQQMQQHKRTRLANREQAILTKFRRIKDRVISLPENNHDLEYMPVQKRDKNLFFHLIQDLCIGIVENMVKGAIKLSKINISNKEYKNR